MSPVELSLPAGLADESVPGLGPSAPGKPSRPGKPTLTLGIPPDCPALDCEPAVALDEPASPLAPAGIPAPDGEPADELEAELDDDDGIDGLLLELLELLGGDGLLGELLDALEGLLGEGIDDDELWLCD
jgi:hypothetical protein